MMIKIWEPDTKFNKIYMFIGNTLTIISAIVAFISWIVQKISSFFKEFPIINKISTIFLYFSVILFIICLVCLIIRILYEATKYKSEALSIQRKLTYFLHKKLVHKIRDNIVELEPIPNKLENYIKIGNSDAISECYNTELNKLKSNLKSYIDELASYLSDYRKDTISVCIKTFTKRDRNRSQFLSEEISSIVRSSNTENTRNNNEKTIVGGNTDFTNLCKGQIVFFASSNLHKIEESGQYINDSINWGENKYTSTLVTPIRYYNNVNNNIKPDIIGFLCIDSKNEIKEWENSDSFELQMLAIFSDILYVYIKEFYKCFEDTGIL